MSITIFNMSHSYILCEQLDPGMRRVSRFSDGPSVGVQKGAWFSIFISHHSVFRVFLLISTKRLKTEGVVCRAETNLGFWLSFSNYSDHFCHFPGNNAKHSLLRCEDLLLFVVIYDGQVNILDFWLDKNEKLSIWVSLLPFKVAGKNICGTCTFCIILRY